MDCVLPGEAPVGDDKHGSGRLRHEDVELLADQTDEQVFTTYSIWNSQRDLDQYRRSPLFEDTWRRTREMFSDSPSAVSYRVVRTAAEIDQLAGSISAS